MQNFKVKIEGCGKKKYNFECYENTESIHIGDKFIFFFAGIVDVQICSSETEREEINQNNRVKDNTKMDFVTGFWRNCYKIKSTNMDLSNIQ